MWCCGVLFCCFAGFNWMCEIMNCVDCANDCLCCLINWLAGGFVVLYLV